MESSLLPQLLDWLYSTQLFGIKLGLSGVRNLLQLASVHPLAARVVHVAGTNGKGSTCAMMESIARAHGLRTGLFTSPHLVDFSERIRIDGEWVDEALLTKHLFALKALAESMPTAPTFFELVFCLALLCFQDAELDLIILETGMGGRLDATNAVPKDLAVIVPIGMDHQQYLGSTLEAIAAEKAAIIQEKTTVFSALQEAPVAAVIEKFAQERHADLHFISECHPLASQCVLLGKHQHENASLALAAMNFFALNDREKCSMALSSVRWPGRFEQRQDRLILDGAHNPHAVRVLVETWKAEMGDERACLIFAASADKQMDMMITMLSEIASEWVLAPVASPRILVAEEMQKHIQRLSTLPCHVVGSISEALSYAESRPEKILVAGSLFLIGEFSAFLDGCEHRATAQ